MARLVYGVSGEGYGHSIRSRVVLEWLRERHEVKIVAGGKAYEYLSRYFEDVIHVDFLNLAYKNNSIQNLKVLSTNFRKSLSLSKSFIVVKDLIKSFKPNFIISDCEALTSHTANAYRIPLVSIGNHHISTNCEITYPIKYYKDFLATKFVTKLMMPNTKYDIVLSINELAVKDKNSFLVKPIIRKEISNKVPSTKDFIMVYQTSDSNTNLLKILSKIDANFVVYGYDMDEDLGNVVLRKFNEEKFIDELSNCKALISNGGFTLITEALHLKKPILSIPIKKSFEQIINAINLTKIGCGEFQVETTFKGIKNFLGNLDIYNGNLKNYKLVEGDVFEVLDRIIQKLEHKKINA